MNGNSDRSAGVEPADAGSANDHASGPGGRAGAAILQALAALEGCNKQEAEEAKRILFAATKGFAAGEG